MAKPQNPIIAQKKMEATLKKNADTIRDMTAKKDLITAKIAFLAVTNYNDNYNANESLLDICEKFEEVYNKIKDINNIDEIIKVCNDTLANNIITREDLEVCFPKDFMTYSSM